MILDAISHFSGYSQFGQLSYEVRSQLHCICTAFSISGSRWYACTHSSRCSHSYLPIYHNTQRTCERAVEDLGSSAHAGLSWRLTHPSAAVALWPWPCPLAGGADRALGGQRASGPAGSPTAGNHHNNKNNRAPIKDMRIQTNK